MPNLLGLLKIEYLYQPQFLVKRLLAPVLGNSHADDREFQLPWGLRIEANPAEEHGKILQTLGVIDTIVSEAIWRLLAPESTFFDVGANIGYMSAVAVGRLASFPQSTGKVIAFEPHPEIFAHLQRNVGKWQTNIDVDRPQIVLHQSALSDRDGTSTLAIPVNFDGNQGLASVVHAEPATAAATLAQERLEHLPIECRRLDDLLGADETIDVMKIDVEGHELAVFTGAIQCLQQQRIHHIIFEAHDGYPSELTMLLESYGYKIWGIDRRLSGPCLVAPDSDRAAVHWLPKNLIATCQPAQVQSAFDRGGWQIFG